MSELNQALAEINAIRAQVARDTQFRGYGPASIATSGFVALLVAAAQSAWSGEAGRDVPAFLTVWIVTAAVSVILAAVETIIRARRVHCGFAAEMVQAAVMQFLPAILAGLSLTVVLLRMAPAEVWMLPGLWQLIFSLGVFASCRFLPPRMFAVGIWYLAAGMTCLVVESGSRTLSPWTMGIPFGVGQLLVAIVLKFGVEDYFEEN